MKDFDAVFYNVGDKVQRKYKEDDKSIKTIRAVDMIERLDSLRYQIIYFEGDTSFYVAYEFEPADPTDRKAYYEHWSKFKTGKTTPNTKANVNKKDARRMVQPPSFIINKSADSKKSINTKK